MGLERTNEINQIGYELSDPRHGAAGRRHRLQVDCEIIVAIGLLNAAAIVGFVTVGDYGITIDEWNADDYGRKALSWYLSGFTDRAIFNDVEETLWYYGPWFHLLTTVMQWSGVAEHWTVRHAMTFLSGLAGIAMVLPMARLAAGRWAGLAAITLCLTTGYLYGSIFFTPIDVPFLLAMTAATLAVMVMAKQIVPSWPATITAGMLTGLAVATRSSGIITQAYLVGAMALCALQAVLAETGPVRPLLARIGIRTLTAMLIGWLTAFALWPWLQIGNPFVHFMRAFTYFANYPAAPLIGRYASVTAAGIGGYVGYQLYLLAALHPLEYIEFNALVGGVRGAYERFDMDYWAASATIALRRLENRRDLAAADRLENNPPSLMICVPWREWLVGAMYRRSWRLETDPNKADYIIATEPDMDCAKNQPVVLIDEVTRFGRPFAWTYARRTRQTTPPSAASRP